MMRADNTAQWIITEEIQSGYKEDWYKCSNCGYQNALHIPRNYCPRCGSLMIFSSYDKRGNNEPEREWTPAREELPELEKYVLCQCRAGIMEILRLTEYGWCDEEECNYMQAFVIAWMPLPEPYKEDNDADSD